MKKKWIGILILLLILLLAVTFTALNKGKLNITGFYKWSGYSENSAEELIKSIHVLKNADGSFTLELSYQSHSVTNDNSFDISGGTYIDTTVTINSNIKKGEVITAYSDSEIERLKHQFIFKKDQLLWRYCVVKNNISNEEMAENIEEMEYCILEK